MSRKNNSIGISILVEFNLNNTISYDDFLEEKHNMYPVVEQSRKTIGNHEYDIMVFEDTAKYQNMGGMRGYYITTRVEYKDKSNSGIEMPIEIEFNSSSAETGKSSYYALKDYFNRINQNINVGILVDSSVEIFEEASDFIFQYLEYVIFE
jgi:hypothetical protein